MYRLDARGLSYEVGGTRILHDLSLSLRSGELVALLGPSGSGKSTLLTSLIGFRPGSGRVELCGRDFYAGFAELKHLIGFVPQDDILHRSLKVRKTLEYSALLRLPAEMPEAARMATVRSVLEQVELSDRAGVRVRNLSGGQRKRVSIAVELLAKPPLLFLDEPTSGLDPALEEKTMKLFRALTTPDRLTVVTTHVLASLELVDLALIMCRGRLVFVGPPASAPEFFGVRDLPGVYKVLASADPREWEQRLRASVFYAELVTRRLAELPPPLPLKPMASEPTSAKGPIPGEGASTRTKLAAEASMLGPGPKPSPEEELARLKAQRRKP